MVHGLLALNQTLLKGLMLFGVALGVYECVCVYVCMLVILQTLSLCQDYSFLCITG